MKRRGGGKGWGNRRGGEEERRGKGEVGEVVDSQ